ncbi:MULTISPECIES: ABC transporter ATP-binding protein [unclassified Synechococcus]|uniref:ABC transporter ATP-binding protein n=1 Tax=unclassified Synechococcus TaxID=2626047 RepID=UPI0021A63D69|nr:MULTISPECIES: ABC transporter ATP-binding protein [unclassified Synechococcus]MCT0211919.1 energy-coupling factor ABC transporter ATP-binding protein [Synechococcus sp. CS-1326]MCT0232331.1 energy-coupling factor ABC transporter ATP-binding protein [Synechococcus sp. CS-1327]
MTSPLVVEQLGFTWPSGSLALDQCSFRLPEPGLWMLVGGNGSGKSTLLRLIAGLLLPQRGRIDCLHRTALVFQNPDHQLLLPSCGTDLQLSLPEGLDRAQRQARVEAALIQVGLGGFEQRPIHTLSGGQKQRLAIAGALASEAGLLLLDEPTALLDPISQQEVLGLIRQLCSRRESPLAALWITHRLEELDSCHAAAQMERGGLGPWQEGRRLREHLERSLPPLAGRQG